MDFEFTSLDDLAEASAGAAGFWASSGYHLLDDPRAGRRLTASPAFLRAYLNRPEIRPVAESCAAERALYTRLMEDPTLAVPPADLAAFEDADARFNYTVFLRFRDLLRDSPSLESAYLALARGAVSGLPRLFVDHLTHLILRHVLTGLDAPLQARAGEIFFRAQRASLPGEAVMLADAETVDAMARTPGQEIDIDLLDEANAQAYWARSDGFDTALEITAGSAGLDAFCRVMENWVRHFSGVSPRIDAVSQVEDRDWRWYLGLDPAASELLGRLYAGKAIDEAEQRNILALFRLEMPARESVRPEMQGRPVYMALCLGEGGLVRMKPQNLLLNLPWSAAWEERLA